MQIIIAVLAVVFCLSFDMVTTPEPDKTFYAECKDGKRQVYFSPVKKSKEEEKEICENY